MMFSPQIYTSLVALRENSVLGAHSDTTIDNIDVFGWFEGNAYACKYVYDADMDAIYWNGQTVAEDAKYLIEDHYEGNKTWHTDKFGNPDDNTYAPCSGEDYIIAELNHDYHYAFDQI